jgi:transcriptional regulator with XRE-family HTH domain
MKPEETVFLDELAKALQHLLAQGAATQQDIERATGVDQTTISRAKSGNLRRVTDKLRRLRRYADMQLNDIKVPAKVDHAARQFLAVGGSEAELLASIEHAISLVTRRLM